MSIKEVLSDQKKLKAFVERRHPEYMSHLNQWQFLEATYKGGREWFDGNIFRYMKEGDSEFTARVDRAYRFNHSREVVDAVNKYIFKAEIERNEEDAPDAVQRFWKNATRSGLDITQFMRKVSQGCSIFGRVWIIVDSTKSSEAVSVADEKAGKARVYAYIVPPQFVLDMSYDEEGQLNWLLVQESRRDDSDPFESSGDVIPRFRLWTRDSWFLFELHHKPKSKQVEIVLVGEGEHGLGVVPAIFVDNVESDNLYIAPSLIGDIAYLDRAVANYLSNLDAIIQDQTFSQLCMPAQGLMPGEDGYQKLLEMGTKRVFVYDGESGASPQYISPDPKQAEMILAVIHKIINEIYHTVGMAGERTKQDNSMGIDNSSGVAKAYDFERMNSLLAAKADALDHAENKLIKLVMLWHGVDSEIEDDLVKYPNDFDIRGLYDEFDIANRLSLLQAPDEVRREQMRLLIEKLFPRISKDLKNKMLKEVESWPPEEVDLTGDMQESAGLKTKAGNSQGQNNKDN